MIDLDNLPSALLGFVTERHLATLTTLNADGSPHVVPVGFTFDEQTQTARVITSGDSVKSRNASRDGARAALCQVAGAHWLTMSGPIRVLTDATSVTDAEQRYAARYRVPRPNPKRVVLLMDVAKAMGQLP